MASDYFSLLISDGWGRRCFWGINRWFHLKLPSLREARPFSKVRNGLQVNKVPHKANGRQNLISRMSHIYHIRLSITPYHLITQYDESSRLFNALPEKTFGGAFLIVPFCADFRHGHPKPHLRFPKPAQ